MVAPVNPAIVNSSSPTDVGSPRSAARLISDVSFAFDMSISSVNGSRRRSMVWLYHHTQANHLEVNDRWQDSQVKSH